MKKSFIILFFLGAFSWILISINKIASTIVPDFSVLWLIAKDFGHVANPYLNPDIYTPSGYPPFTYLFYIPLTVFSFKSAQFIFLYISLAAILGSVFLSLKLVFGKADFYTFLFASALTLISFPVKFTLGMGQINGIVLFLLLTGFYLSENSKDTSAGILIGIASMLKPIFGFFFLFFLIRKRWKLIYYGLLTIIAYFSLTFVLYGLSLWEYWIKQIVVPLLNLAGREVYYDQGFVGFFSRFIKDIELRKLAEYFAYIFGLIVIFLSRRKNNIQLLSLFILTLLLIDSLSWQHHFVWLIFPFTLTVYFALKIKKLWIWFLIFFSYFLVSWNFKNPSAVPVIFLSNTFYGTIIIYFLNLYFLKLDLNNYR